MYAAAKPLSWDSNDFHLTLSYILGTPLYHLSEMTRHICILHEYILNDNKLSEFSLFIWSYYEKYCLLIKDRSSSSKFIHL